MNITDEDLRLEILQRREAIKSELSAVECLRDAFEVLKGEGEPFAKADVVRLASEFRLNDPLSPSLDPAPINLSIFYNTNNEKMKQLSEEISQFTIGWRRQITSARSKRKYVRPRHPDIPKSARPA